MQNNDVPLTVANTLEPPSNASRRSQIKLKQAVQAETRTPRRL